MYIEALGRQMAVCSFEGAARLVTADKHYWNVVSICGPQERRAELPEAKSIHHVCFDDVEVTSSAIYRPPRATDVVEIFAFIRSLGVGSPAPPLLVHCRQGLSRSAAVVLSWIYGQLPGSGDRLAEAIELLLQLRPSAKPNLLVLSFGLAQCMPADEARKLAKEAISEPRLARNRFEAEPEG